MKVKELTEQHQRRRSPEELAAMKAAPDYWKVGVRKEFNDLLKKFGATSRETAGNPGDKQTINFHRSISVFEFEGRLTLHRDKRARALIMALAKWLKSKVDAGYYVSVGHWGSPALISSTGLKKTDSLEEVMRQLNEATRIDQIIDLLRQRGESGEKDPIRFDLRMSMTQPKPAAE